MVRRNTTRIDWCYFISKNYQILFLRVCPYFNNPPLSPRRGEFLAVRNADSGFFLCQTLHNVYKSSPRIRIRWLSELAATGGDGVVVGSSAAADVMYEVDFYDHTDLECVLTSLDLERVQKNYRLAGKERERIENILRRAIDVETGVLPRPSVTAENPDGCECAMFSIIM